MFFPLNKPQRRTLCKIGRLKKGLIWRYRLSIIIFLPLIYRRAELTILWLKQILMLVNGCDGKMSRLTLRDRGLQFARSGPCTAAGTWH
jgi:hypothetical protein